MKYDKLINDLENVIFEDGYVKMLHLCYEAVDAIKDLQSILAVVEIKE